MPTATAALSAAQRLLDIVENEDCHDATALIHRLRSVAAEQIAAAPHDQIVGNVVRRVLDIAREVVEDDDPAVSEQRSQLFGLFQGTVVPSGPSDASPATKADPVDIKAGIIEGIEFLLDELDSADDTIASSAPSHIATDDTILVYGSSPSIHKFLSAAARKCKFTVYYVLAHPNDHEETHALITQGHEDANNKRWKPLTAAGIKVIVIPDTAVYAVMSSVDKIILESQNVHANGSFTAAAGAASIVQAAKERSVPVVVLAAIYKISPLFAFETGEFTQYGDPGKVVPYQSGQFMDKVDVLNPLHDHIEAEYVASYLTEKGPKAPLALKSIIDDHYWAEDNKLAVTG